MRYARKLILPVAAMAVLVPMMVAKQAIGSDHADTPSIAARPGVDITDVFMFPSPENPQNVVLVMTVNPLITPNTVGSTSFDPNVLYQFKIDNTGDYVEDLVIQAKFVGTGPGQQVEISGPSRPAFTGTAALQLQPYATKGNLNQSFTPTQNMRVFCGVREDPFFFDLERFFEILPDRATPLTGIQIPDPNNPQVLSWRPPGEAVDFLSNGHYSVLAIVIELPKVQLITQQG